MKHKIRRKAVRELKTIPDPPEQNPRKYQEWKDRLVGEIDRANREQRKVIYLDEVVFTRKTLLRKAYSHRLTNLAVNGEGMAAVALTAIAAVSAERGTEHVMITEGHTDNDKFKKFVRKLLSLNKGRKLALFMDNMSAHKEKSVKELYDLHDILPLYNIPYLPATNPIEACFSIVKGFFKRKRLERLVNDKPFDYSMCIDEAFDLIDPESVENNAARSMTILRELNFLP